MPYFFRHCLKLHNNGSRVDGIASCPWDPPLMNPNHDDYLLKVVASLPKITRIISSPFLRCRQTTELLKRYLQEIHQNKIEIVYEPLIREYLGNWKSKKIFVEQDTYKHLGNSRLIEDALGDVYVRMNEFDDKYDLTDSDCIVSHKLCIKILGESCYSQGVDLSSPGFVTMNPIYEYCITFPSRKYAQLYLQLQKVNYTLPILRELGMKVLQDETVFLTIDKNKTKQTYSHSYMIFKNAEHLMSKIIEDIRRNLNITYTDVSYDASVKNRIVYTMF